MSDFSNQNTFKGLANDTNKQNNKLHETSFFSLLAKKQYPCQRSNEKSCFGLCKGASWTKGQFSLWVLPKEEIFAKRKKSKSSLALDLTCFEKMLKTSHCNLLFSSQKQGATSWISLWAMPISSLVLIFPICSSAWPYFQRGNGRNKSFRWFNINLQRQSAIKKTI